LLANRDGFDILPTNARGAEQGRAVKGSYHIQRG